MAYEENFTADRLQDALVAETIFNWVWLERLLRNDATGEFRKGLFPPENDSDGWERCNYWPEGFRHANPQTPCFADWPRCSYKPNKKTYWQIDDNDCPRFTTNIRHDYMVLERVTTHFKIDEIEEFKLSLEKIWHDRRYQLKPCQLEGFVLYKPGDYAKAALMMFKKFNPEHPAFVERRVYQGQDA